MQKSGANSDTEPGTETSGSLRSDAEIAQKSENLVNGEAKLRIRPINVFELARRVYSSKKTSLRPSKLFRS